MAYKSNLELWGGCALFVQPTGFSEMTIFIPVLLAILTAKVIERVAAAAIKTLTDNYKRRPKSPTT